ncbi:hypothetical protein [Okeania sp. KiyG1]|uniref:hypothetical protein n=1 Tax=Okeania sp. KiyG1 TaxID=2720165 RepID=UPI001F183BB0|nr:hypothetical protein [Okeania sp. KiyG1]
MKPEYDLTKMKSRPNPYAKKLKQQVNLSLGVEVIEYFEKKSTRKRNFVSTIN